MSPHCHPSQSLLADYAAGILPLAPGLVVSAHAEGCPACRAQLAAFEQAEGALIEAIDPIPMASGSLEHVLSQLDAPVAAEPATPSAVSSIPGVHLPSAVRRTGLGSRRWLAPGLWAAPVLARRTSDWRAFLLHAPAGAVIPTHRHVGGEYIAVLAGALHDGRTYDAGDFAEGAASSDHHLNVAGEGPCLCLIAIQGRIQWRGWARAITPLLGI